MNWYFLLYHELLFCGIVVPGEDQRYHLLEALERGLDIGTRRDIILYPVDEWRIWDAAGICGRYIFSAWLSGGISQGML